MGRAAGVVGVVRQGALRTLQRLARVRAADSRRARWIVSQVAPVQLRHCETLFYALEPLPLLWSTLRLVNQCEPAGPSPELAYASIIAGILASVGPTPGLAGRWCRRALAIAEETGTERDVAFMLSRTAVVQMGRCQWRDAAAGLARATALAEEMGDLRLWEETRVQRALIDLFTGRYEDALGRPPETRRVTRRSDNRQVRCWTGLLEGHCLARLGRDQEAIVACEEVFPELDPIAMRSELVLGAGSLALARLRAGEPQRAYETVEHVLPALDAGRPVAYWLQPGLAGIAEVLLALLEDGADLPPAFRMTLAHQAHTACRALRRYARPFPLGRAHAALWDGLRAWLRGHQRRALRSWRRAIGLAEALGLPYEGARAHLEIGRHALPGAEARRRHLDEAARRFEALGCRHELEWARAELARGPRLLG